MQVNSAANSAQLRRNVLETQRSEKSSTKAAESDSQSAQTNNNSTSDGQVLQQLGDRAAEAFVNKKPSGIFDGIKDILDGKATDERAAKLFEGVDTDNPTLVANEGGFEVNAVQGPEDSTYIDLGNGAEVFVITQSNGDQVAYRVENGELGERIPSTGSTDIGNDIYVSTSESPAGDSEINFQQGPNSLSNLWNRPPTMTLNSDSGTLTTKTRERGGFLNLSVSTEVNSFDIQSGQQIVTDGEPDLDKMSLEQQFDYYADTPEGARILNTEGNHYNTNAEKALLIARAQYVRGEGGPELFNDFTPHRASLTGDDLVAYDAAVQDLMNEMREEGVYNTGTIDQDGPIDESLLYITASAAVEAYAGSPDVLEAVKGDIDKWIFSTDNANAIGVGVSGSSAAWYNTGGIVQFGLGPLIRDYVNPNDDYEIVPHELAHSLDNSDGSFDGLPPGLSDEDAQLFIDERTRLFELAYPDGFDVTDSREEYLTDIVDSSGLRPYAFYNQYEFMAVVTETFLSSDANAEKIKNASPELYNLLREYYGRDDLPVAKPPGTDLPPGWPPIIDWPPVVTKPPVIDWPPVIKPPVIDLPPITKPPVIDWPPIGKPF